MTHNLDFTAIARRSSTDHIALGCVSLIRQHAAVSAAVSVIPVPGADVAVDLANAGLLFDRIVTRFGLSRAQLNLLGLEAQAAVLQAARRQGCVLVGRVFTKDLLLRFAGRGLGRTLARRVGRFVPIIGTGISACIGYATTAKLGEAILDECVRVHLSLRATREAMP